MPSARGSRSRWTRAASVASRSSRATRSAHSTRCAPPGSGSPELERLVEHDLALERAVHGALGRDLHEPFRLLLGKLLRQADRHRELGGRALLGGFVVHVDHQLADRPALALRVHLDGDRRARGQARGQELLRARTLVGPTVVRRLVRGHVMRADLEVVLEVLAVAACCWPHHYSRGLKTSPVGILGKKYVDFGGIDSPASATSRTCSTGVPRMKKAASQRPDSTASRASAKSFA